MTSSALQSRKWQLIGMSQWCHSALCGHPLPALTDSWTHGAASRHPIALISHTRPSTRSCSYYVCLMTTLFQHQHTAPRMCNSWTAALRNAKLFLRPTCGLQTAQISVPVDYEIWAVMQRRVYPETNPLCGWIETAAHWCPVRSWTVDFWRDYWRDEDIGRVSMPKEDISSTTCELTMLILSIYVMFNVICLTVSSLIKKSCQRRQYLFVHFTR